MPSALQQAIVVLAVLAGACAAEPAPPPPAATLTDGAGLAPNDAIGGLDLAVDATGNAHALWIERTRVYGGFGGTERLVYREGVGSPLRWGPRTVLAEGAIGASAPRLVAARDGVHALAGPHLRHWWRPAAGTAFRDAGTLLADTGPVAGPFTAHPAQDGFLVVFLAAGRAGSGEGTYALRWREGAATPPVAIAPAGAAERASPALVGEGGTWTVAWPDNAFVEVRDPRVGNLPGVRAEAGVAIAVSRDDGARWTAPRRVTPALPSSVSGIALAGGAEGPALFFAANGLFRTALDAGTGTPPVRVAAYAPGALSGSADTSAVAATTCHGHTALAWVDARNRRSDRRWWNPLGGFPWGDNPDWANNDLFAATRLPADPRAAGALAPTRLTPAGAMTDDVAIAARGDALLVLHSGRAQVRKAPVDAGAAPDVLVTVVPCM